MSTTTNPPRSSVAHGAGDSRGTRPLPKGIVGIGQPPCAARKDSAPAGTLIVGPGIEVRGEIDSCKVLRVEGHVEASLDAEILEVLKGGVFKGTAVVDRAEIAGTVEGELTVRKILNIASTGRAEGKIRYSDIAIVSGGRIIGDVDEARTTENPAREESTLRAATGA